MDLEDIAFEAEPQIDDFDVDTAGDVKQLLDKGVINYPGSYGFDEADEFIEYVTEHVFGDYDSLQAEELEKWERFTDRYSEAGGIFYNPENGDEYYTDRTGLKAEDLEGK